MKRRNKSLIIDTNKINKLDRIAKISGMTKASIFNLFVKLCVAQKDKAELHIRKKSANELSKERTKRINFALNEVSQKIIIESINWNATFSEYLDYFIARNEGITELDNIEMPQIKNIYIKS